MNDKKEMDRFPDKEIGARLKQAREAAGMKQWEVAKALRMSENGYQNYERGRRLKTDKIIQLCAVLHCSPNWLLGVSDKGMRLRPDSLLMRQLDDAFERLNETGRQEALKRVQEMSSVPAYVGEEKNGARDKAAS